MAGADWDIAQTLSDEDLEARLYRPALPRCSHQRAPDFGLVHQELKRAGVTLMLRWEECASANLLACKYTSFCIKYREFALRQQRSMRQVQIVGETLFVDHAGDTVPIIDAATGKFPQAQIFVATLGASNYTYACATPRQTTADWTDAQVQALEFIGGVPLLIVPDQTRSLIKTPTATTPNPTAPTRNSHATTAARCWPRARRTRATSPRSRARCSSCRDGSRPACATAGTEAWPS